MEVEKRGVILTCTSSCSIFDAMYDAFASGNAPSAGHLDGSRGTNEDYALLPTVTMDAEANKLSDSQCKSNHFGRSRSRGMEDEVKSSLLRYEVYLLGATCVCSSGGKDPFSVLT